MASSKRLALQVLAAGAVAGSGAMTGCGAPAAGPPDSGSKWPRPNLAPAQPKAPPQMPQAPVSPPQAAPRTAPQTAPGNDLASGMPPAKPEPPPAAPQGDRQTASKARWTFDDMPIGPLEGQERSDQAVGKTEVWRNLFDAAWRGAGGRDERPMWVVRGRWEIAQADRPGLTGRVLRQVETRSEPVASFVQPSWPGGPGAPARYRVAVSVAAEVAPRGQESPLLVWFRDVSHYAEIVAKPRSVEVWTADGAVPDRAEGWDRAWYKNLVTASGEVRRLEAVVDTKAGRMGVWVDGERLGEAAVPLVSGAGSYSIALRATGGPIAYDDLEVEALD